MLSIHDVSMMMRIFYIDWQQHWECDRAMNIGDQQNSHKWQTSVDQLTVGLPVTSERCWASFQVTRLFHKETVSHCDHFLLQHMYLLFETSPGWSQGWRAATKQLYKWYFPSVCLSHLFDYVPIIVSSWSFQELLPMTKVRSMEKVKVRGQRSRLQRSQPDLTVSGL